MTALVAAVFVASLVGSVHCAGMCGAFVCAYSAGATRLSHAAYHGARLVTYASLGAIAGIIGAGITEVGALLAIQRLAALVAGALMILWGSAAILSARGVRVPRLVWPAAPQRWLHTLVRRAGTWSPTQRAATLGAVTTLLPCGWLYAFVVTAAGTGDVRSAMLVMSVFWLGTVPALLVVAAGVRRLAAPWRERVPVLTATSIVVVGLLTIALHLMPRDHAAHTGVVLPSESREQNQH